MQYLSPYPILIYIQLQVLTHTARERESKCVCISLYHYNALWMQVRCYTQGAHCILNTHSAWITLGYAQGPCFESTHYKLSISLLLALMGMLACLMPRWCNHDITRNRQHAHMPPRTAYFCQWTNLHTHTVCLCAITVCQDISASNAPQPFPRDAYIHLQGLPGMTEIPATNTPAIMCCTFYIHLVVYTYSSA